MVEDSSIQRDVPLHDKTSYKIGGTADYYREIKTLADIIDTLRWAQTHTQNVFVLGKGSNILMSDAGWRGIILDMSVFKKIEWNQSQVYCEAGALFMSVVMEATTRGLSGIQECAGIPGTIGGCLIMNAGAYSQTISDCLDFVDYIDCVTLQTHRVYRSQITFSYRHSSLQNTHCVIYGAQFSFIPGEQSQLISLVQHTLSKRASNQPLDKPSCGSVFKRPVNGYAGALIEQAGLKGFRIGNAEISTKHANFIVNLGNAHATDILDLIIQVRERVYTLCGVLLEPEVIFVGSFDQGTIPFGTHYR